MPSALLSLVYTKPSCENPCDQRCGILALKYWKLHMCSLIDLHLMVIGLQPTQ